MLTEDACQYIATLVLIENPLDLEKLMKIYCPNAVGMNHNGWILPSRDILKTVQCKQYIKALEMADIRSIVYWLNVMNAIRNDGYSLTSFKGTITFEIMKANLGFNCNQHCLPIIREFKGYSSNRIRADWVPYTEFMEHYKIEDVEKLFLFIIQIILFGFPIIPEVFIALKIYNPGKYVASRLFQGWGDIVLGTITNSLNAYSSFMKKDWFKNASRDEADVDESLQKMMYTSGQPKRQKIEMAARLQNLRTKLNHGTYIGRNQENLITLMESKLFSFGDMAYEEYLKRDSPGFLKVGMKPWKYIIYGDGEITQEGDSIEFWGDHSAESTDNYTGAEWNLVR